MHASEDAELSVCVDCGAEIWPERDRSYLVTGEDALCYECARKRGGVYDEVKDRWETPPNLRNLAPPSP